MSLTVEDEPIEEFGRRGVTTEAEEKDGVVDGGAAVGVVIVRHGVRKGIERDGKFFR